MWRVALSPLSQFIPKSYQLRYRINSILYRTYQVEQLYPLVKSTKSYLAVWIVKYRL